jgi:hypothetical protein
MGFPKMVSGWQRDFVDLRDFNASTHARRLDTLRPLFSIPEQIDWREYLPEAEDQLSLPAGAAHACVAAIQYFTQRATGCFIRPSRLFVHLTGERLLFAGERCPSLRTSWKAIARFGAPPERLLPYCVELQDAPAFAYGFQRDFAELVYLRIAERGQSHEAALEQVRRWLAAGFVLTFGVPLYSSVSAEADMPFPTRFDALCGGQALLAVGYDDQKRIRSDKGALLVRNSWGVGWGDKGYGWLPYTYISEGLAADFWTVLHPLWLDPNEFCSPLSRR